MLHHHSRTRGQGQRLLGAWGRVAGVLCLHSLLSTQEAAPPRAWAPPPARAAARCQPPAGSAGPGVTAGRPHYPVRAWCGGCPLAAQPRVPEEWSPCSRGTCWSRPETDPAGHPHSAADSPRLRASEHLTPNRRTEAPVRAHAPPSGCTGGRHLSQLGPRCPEIGVARAGAGPKPSHVAQSGSWPPARSRLVSRGTQGSLPGVSAPKWPLPPAQALLGPRLVMATEQVSHANCHVLALLTRAQPDRLPPPAPRSPVHPPLLLPQPQAWPWDRRRRSFPRGPGAASGLRPRSPCATQDASGLRGHPLRLDKALPGPRVLPKSACRPSLRASDVGPDPRWP